MGVSLMKNDEQTLDYTISQQIPNGPTTIDVDIQRDDWETGYIVQWDTDTGDSERRSMNIVVTRDEDDAWDQSIYNRKNIMPKGCIGYVIDNWSYAGFSYASIAGPAGKLSEYSYGATGNYIRLVRTWIEGSDLRMEWYNRQASAQWLKIEGRVRLTRRVLRVVA